MERISGNARACPLLNLTSGNMAQPIQKTAIITLHVRIDAGHKIAFADWQASFNSHVAAQPSFVSLEFLSTMNAWVIVQRFSSRESALLWTQSEIYQKLLQELRNLAVDRDVEEKASQEEDLQGSVTELFVTEVSPDKEASYRAWLAKIHQAEAKFPGFRGTYVQSPSQTGGRNWITLLHFDTVANLDRWIASREREEVLKQGASLVISLESHRVISPFTGWFASFAKAEGEIPPVWKQTCLILLVLFPVVMLEFRYLLPWTRHLNPSLGTFIGNALSVALISWPLMPLSIWFLGWWLAPLERRRTQTTLFGTFFISLLYAIEIFAFWNFL
ncbi:MAG: putative antibiotic biosynthesis monooxygenase [Chlamydiia bacterium]|nr:putative antibiotic biosynthesis monooxygenase [Chlamydiia bacterium]